MIEIRHDTVRMLEQAAGFQRRVAILAGDEFDRNFERQSFFGTSWAASKYVSRRGGRLLIRSGALRRSIHYQIQGDRITFRSNRPYASIHNEGGTIKHPGGTAYLLKEDGKAIFVSNRQAKGQSYKRTQAHDIEIPARPFIGNHPQLDGEIEREFDQLFKI
jgi:phage gpG-like protein